MKIASLNFLFLLFFINTLFGQNTVWQELFNGKDLAGWKRLNGTAEYLVSNGEIIGISRLNTPNTFLVTEKEYGDFILEVEVWVDAGLNSGIQIRSHSTPEFQNGRVHGYQVEIDPSDRAYSGGIYDEAGRGWLYTLAENPAGRSAFKNGQWNHYHIEAIGNEIRTWINGVNCSNVVDDRPSSGFIALQVHSIGNKDLEGTRVKWKSIRIKTENPQGERWEMRPDVKEVNYIPHTLTDYEKRKGWRLLWDGKTMENWMSANGNNFPETGWEIKEEILTILGTKGGDIVTKNKFGDFELIVEFKLAEGANSGIKYFVDPSSGLGLEYQLLDDEKHPDAKNGVDGNRTLASLYDLIPAKNLSVPSRGKDFRGIDKWNQERIVVKGDHVEHWMNEFKMVEYDRDVSVFKALIKHSKYSDKPNFGEADSGHILLQDHGDKVQFRTIKIREF